MLVLILVYRRKSGYVEPGQYINVGQIELYFRSCLIINRGKHQNVVFDIN